MRSVVVSARSFYRTCFSVIAMLVLFGSLSAPARSGDLPPKPVKLTGKKWSDMDYGPYTTLSLEVEHGNIAYKGISIRLDEGEGGVAKGSEFALFETDTLRLAAGWRGEGFIDWRGIFLNGEHNFHPALVGNLVAKNPVAPGWGNPADGSFEDTRIRGKDDKPYGPLDESWADWKGLYVHGDQVVLNYTVGETEVLESPSAEGAEGSRAIARTLNIGPRKVDMILQVAEDARANIDLASLETPKGSVAQYARLTVDTNRPAVARRSGENGDSFGGNECYEIDKSKDFDFASDYTLYARIKTEEGGTIISKNASSGPWVEGGKTFFIQEGRLAFDIGWVGYVVSDDPVAAGDWHQVAMTYEHEEGRVTFYIDGKESGGGSLKATDDVEDHTVKIGYTSTDFPQDGDDYFDGRIKEVRVYDKLLSGEQITGLSEESLDESIKGRWTFKEVTEKSVSDKSGKKHVARRVRDESYDEEAPVGDTLVAVVNGSEGLSWIATEEGALRLKIPAGPDPIQLKILYGQTALEGDVSAFLSTLAESIAPQDLSPLTKGGPTTWTEKLVTQGEVSEEEGAYVIDCITPPMENPYRSRMRFGGIDFFKDESKAALCTWNGDVWIVTGIDYGLEELTWQRIAAGLFQPLGLKIVDDEIYVLCRDQITLLHDLNGDGETDFYENFNNDAQVTEHFHEFALDLQMGADGNFYYTKGGRHAKDSLVPQHGTLMRVSADGKTSEIVVNGFRAPNGLGIGPNMEFLVSDNEGHWTPANRINWVTPGGFYGYMWSYIEGQEIEGYTPPLCWIPPKVDRSPGTFVWVPDYRWGPLKDHILTVSYGMGQIFHVMYEEVDGVVQGGVVRFPLEFDTGVCRAKFRKRDGQLYLAGLFGWSSNKTKPGAFYRVRYTGQNLYMPEEIHIAKEGLSLSFTDPLDPDSATDVGNYGIKVWNYDWREKYGSPDYKLDGKEGRDTIEVTSASLSPDRKTVYLEIPEIQTVMQMEIRLNLEAADGSRVRFEVYNTINKIGDASIKDWMGQGVLTGKARIREKPKETEQGLIQSLASTEGGQKKKDTRLARLCALYVPEGESVTPFISEGSFTSSWSGYLQVDLNETYGFSVEGKGKATLTLNGEKVLEGDILGGLLEGNPMDLKSGFNRFQLDYDSPREGASELRLFWKPETFPREPVPATAFFHNPDRPALKSGMSNRYGRELIANNRCLKCHTTEPVDLERAMPELSFEAPTLEGIGQRFQESWLATWFLDPIASRGPRGMPRLLHKEDSRSPQKAADIAAYLTSLSPPRESTSDFEVDADLASRGETLYNDLGCLACHYLSGEPEMEGGETRLSLAQVSSKWRIGALKAFLLDPQKNYGARPMPNFGLSQEEAEALVHYLRRKSKTDDGTSSPPRGDTANGKKLLVQSGCLNCHSLENHSSELTSPTLSKLLERDLSGGCLAAEARGAAPDFGFEKEEVAAIQGILREETDSLFRKSAHEFAARQVKALDCLACHARDGVGNRWNVLAPEPEVEEFVWDWEEDYKEDSGEDFEDDFEDYFEDEEEVPTIHYRRPPLDWAGEKLHSAWTEQLLAGTLPYKTRPKLPARMPAFPAYAKQLALGLAAEHGYPPSEAKLESVDDRSTQAGRRLTSEQGGFSCISCHGIGDRNALAGADTVTINFEHVAERLRKSYYERYIRNPQRVLPGTQMPMFLDRNGNSALKDVLDGDAQKQFEAIWRYFVKLNGDRRVSESN